MYRRFTITDLEGKKIKFKVWPNLAPPFANKIVYEKVEIELTLATNNNMLKMVEATNSLMNGNTINKVEVEEFDDE